MKKITTADIAKAAGVSTATVSYVLNNTENKSISEETRARVKNCVKELDYRPNPYAKGLRTKSSKIIALILPTITDPSMPVLIKGIEMATDFNEYSIIIHDLEAKSKKNRLEDLETLCEKAIDGIIVAYLDDSDEEIIKNLITKRGIPMVVIGRSFINLQVNRVESDMFNAGETIAEYLYGLGHRKIVFITGGSVTRGKKLRIEGFNSVLRRYGLESNIVIYKDSFDNRSIFFDTREYDGGYIATIDLMEKGVDFTAVVGSNDLVSVGVMQALKAKGVKIPEDISVASIGGFFISEVIDPKLTVVAQPAFEIGKTAFDVLKSILDKERHNALQNIVFKYKLIVRESTGRIKL